MIAPLPPADAITVAQTLTLLDGGFQSFVRGVAENRYAFWLGSGISMGRVDGLNELVYRVVEFIRARVNVGNPACRFRKAIEEVLDIANLTNHEKHQIDLTESFDQWQNAGNIATRLRAEYARLLDILVEDEEEDYLLWNGIDVVSTYADPELEPGRRALVYCYPNSRGSSLRHSLCKLGWFDREGDFSNYRRSTVHRSVCTAGRFSSTGA